MKKIVSLLVILVLFFSCKEEVVKKPDRLIEKGMMIDVMYDLSLLEAIKYNTPSSSETYNINPQEYIYKKYEIDSTQFSQNNIYYAANYAEYKDMFDKVTRRIDGKKVIADSLVKIVKKRDSLNLVKKKNLAKKDSLNLIKKKKSDSLKGIKKKPLSKKDSLNLIKKKNLLKKVIPQGKTPVKRITAKIN